MCRCCQTCLEDCYWSCIEEKFCYDETIANYDPDDDYEYSDSKKSTNLDNNNSPICVQPQRIQNNVKTVSSKCHQEELRREIQTTVPILAPEILAVFANSQIFHEDPPIKSPTLAAVHSSRAKKITDSETDQLLKRLEGTDSKHHAIGSYSSLPKTRIRIITEEEDEEEDAQMRFNPKFSNESDGAFPINKRLERLQPPFFSTRPASENDIFTIASSFGRISTTPEVPSVSFANLPKNYMETPTIEKYRESVSLYEIQTAGILKSEEDYSMPRYYRKSELMLPTSRAEAIESTPKNLEISKRLKTIRTHLPPLQIASKEKLSEIAPIHQHHM